MLEKIKIREFTLENGTKKTEVNLFYQVFGRKSSDGPVVLVNHALTGNSDVAGENGWWKKVVGPDKVIDTNHFTVVAFNVPGNGFDGIHSNTIEDYKNFTAKDIADLFWKGLEFVNITELYAIIGGSLGGGIAWEMAVLKPKQIKNLIPVAADCKATNWVIGNVLIQDQILNNSDDPIADARLHAMFLYRTPKSINQKFAQNNETSASVLQVESWLMHHGVKLKNRFSLPAYKMMNHLLKTIDISRKSNNLQQEITRISAAIHLIAIDSDLLFTAEDIKKTYEIVKDVKPNIFYNEIKSIHGHDAFLIEYEQLTNILRPIFQNQKQLIHVST